MAKLAVQLLLCIVFFHTNVHNVNGEGVTFGALLGQETGKPRSVYYDILDHAMSVIRANSTFLTQFHKDVSQVLIEEFYEEALYPALQTICSFVEDNVPSTLIVTEDTSDNDVGTFISHALGGPIFTVDPGQMGSGSRAVKMYPVPEDMSVFLLDMLDYFKWRKWTIVYEGSQYNTFGDILVHASAMKFNVTLREYTGDVPALADKIKADGNQNILLMTESEESTLEIINEGIGQGIFSRSYTWMLAFLDVFIDRTLEEILEEEGVYITRFKMNYTTEWQYTYPSIQINNRESREWSMREKLVFDSFVTAAYGLRRYHERRSEATGQSLTNIFPGDSVIRPCNQQNSEVVEVSDLYKDMQWYNFEGLTGNIALDEMGNRVNYSLMVYSGRGRALNQLRGEWVQNPAHWEERYTLPFESESRFNITRYLKGEDRKLQIISIEAPPFLVSKTDGEKDATNGRFEGFIMELLEEIKNSIKRIEFNYEVELVPDGKYGRPGKYSKIWSGMVGEVVRGNADIAAGPLTIRPDRSGAVSFTYPFMDAGIKVMVQHPNHVKDGVFKILHPFAVEVWVLNAILFFLVSLILYLCNYFSPYEWRAAAERGDVFEENHDNFDAKNSMWFLASTLFLQSYDASPRSNAGRVITVFWWAFVIIMVFLLLSNLPRHLNFSKQLTKIRTMHELVDQVEIQPGLIESESTFYYFKKSKDNTNNQFYKTIQNAKPTGKVASMEEAVARIRDSGGKYAFLGEAPILEYEASKEPCDLFVGSGTLVQQSYALAVRKGSPLEEPLSHAIQNLRDNGVIHRLELNYWDRHSRCGNLTTWQKQGIYSYTSYDLKGLYCLFAFGIAISLITFLIEFMCCGEKRKRKPKQQKPADRETTTHATSVDYELRGVSEKQEKQWL